MDAIFVEAHVNDSASSALRLWDYASAARVDEFIANSRNVQGRIWHTYRRESSVIYPPVAVTTFRNQPAQDFCLTVSELVPYKRLSDAVRVFSRTGRKLRVVGEGPEYKTLRRMANRSIEFCGRVSDEELRDLYASSLAFVMPGEEDFGMAAVEALASGKPVVALGRGGALETVPVVNPCAGVLYGNPGEEELERALVRLDNVLAHIDPKALRAHAQRFSEAEFYRSMKAAIFGPSQLSAKAARSG